MHNYDIITPKRTGDEFLEVMRKRGLTASADVFKKYIDY